MNGWVDGWTDGAVWLVGVQLRTKTEGPLSTDQAVTVPKGSQKTHPLNGLKEPAINEQRDICKKKRGGASENWAGTHYLDFQKKHWTKCLGEQREGSIKPSVCCAVCVAQPMPRPPATAFSGGPLGARPAPPPTALPAAGGPAR